MIHLMLDRQQKWPNLLQIYVKSDVIFILFVSGSGSGQMTSSQNDKGKYNLVGRENVNTKSRKLNFHLKSLVQSHWVAPCKVPASRSSTARLCREVLQDKFPIPDSWQSPDSSWWVLLFLWTSSQLQVSSTTIALSLGSCFSDQSILIRLTFHNQL